jgi:hypothetical protein
MKRFLVLIVLSFLVFSLNSCKKRQGENDNNLISDSDPQTQNDNNDDNDDDNDIVFNCEDNEFLVYYNTIDQNVCVPICEKGLQDYGEKPVKIIADIMEDNGGILSLQQDAIQNLPLRAKCISKIRVQNNDDCSILSNSWDLFPYKLAYGKEDVKFCVKEFILEVIMAQMLHANKECEVNSDCPNGFNCNSNKCEIADDNDNDDNIGTGVLDIDDTPMNP